MNNVKGSTANETRLIKGIQSAIGANPDGIIGPQTISDLACKLKANCFPVTLKVYNMPVIIARDIVPIAAPNKGLSAFPNSISGSFYIAQAVGSNVPVSICVSGGVVHRQYACHAREGYPESVLYRLKSGEIGIKRVNDVGQLPYGLSWAVGGMGLLEMYNPTSEGFVGKFSDVLRNTNHTMLGVKNGHVYMAYCKAMTGKQVNDFAQLLGLEKSIMLDGGHVAAINGAESFAKINTALKQAYVIQAV